MLLKDWIGFNSNKISSQELYYLLTNLFEVEVLDENLFLSFFVQKSLDLCLSMRVNGVPLAKILHKKWFYNDCFLTTFDTLDPRPETEFLIEKIKNKPRRVLELGVGTGCLLLSIVKKFYRAKGLGVDISQKALDIAKKNADLLDLSKNVEFRLNNWGFGIKGDFDVVVCNPPYVDKNLVLSKETLYDPSLALFGSIDIYKEIKKSLEFIDFHQLLFEVPKRLLKGVVKLFEEKHVEYFQVYDTDIFIVSIV